jgi:hypothetical protein
MRPQSKHVLGFAVLGVIAVLPACGGGRPVYSLTDAGFGTLTGEVVKGPVQLATVTAYSLDAKFNQGNQLATAQADTTGHFTLTLPPYGGHILFIATGGTYTEEAVGAQVSLAGVQLKAVMHDYLPGQPSSEVLITPISDWAVALASFWTLSDQEPLPQAMDDAYSHLNAHFGGLDWRAVEPTDFNAVDAGVQLDDPDRAGFILAGLSQQARGISNRAATTPAVSVTALSLVLALEDDIGFDGYFDGVGKEGPLHLPASQPVLPASSPASATALDGQTVRGALALSLSNYLQNPLDTSGLSFRDVQGLLSELSTDADPRLFRSGGTPYDINPPFLAFAPTPPLYTPDASYTLGVLAADPGSGVADVYAQTGANAQLVGVAVSSDAGMLADGGCVFGTTSSLPDAGCISATLYQFPLQFPTQGHYPYVVWAVDHAGNSNQTTGTELSFTITFDDSPPNISIETGTFVYWNEQAMTLRVDAGLPIIPPQYQVVTQQSSVFATGNHDVYKAGTRLSWGDIDGGPTAAELNTQDPSSLNVPFIPVDISYDPSIDAPIVSVTYSASCSGPTCGSFTSAETGNLIFDPTTTSSARYLLALTSDTLPGLAQISGPTRISLAVTATDGAGNTSTAPAQTVTFHVIGPPLVLVEQTDYSGADDSHSSYPYHIANGTYATAFDGGASAFEPDQLVRLVRYVVYNPATQPVALNLQSTGDWSAAEEWDDDVAAMSQFQDINSTADGLWCPNYMFNWSLSYEDDGDRCGIGDPTWPCTSTPVRLTHSNGYNGCVVCDQTAIPVAHTNPPATEAAAALAPSYYGNPQPNGGEKTIATALTNQSTYFIVPAAMDNQPGALAIYVNRPVVVTRSKPLFWQNIYPAGGIVTHYQYYVADFWDGNIYSTCTDSMGNMWPMTVEDGARDLQNLDSAQGIVSGTITPWTSSVEPATGTQGYGESQSFEAITVTATIPQ